MTIKSIGTHVKERDSEHVGFYTSSPLTWVVSNSPMSMTNDSTNQNVITSLHTITSLLQ